MGNGIDGGAGRAAPEAAPLTGSALILGGGKGSRLGYDKKLLAVNGVPVLDSLVALLSSEFSAVVLSANDLSVCGIPVVQDILGEGPLAGLYAGLCACASAYLFVCACDMPFISAGFIRYLKALIQADHARGALKDIYMYRAASGAGKSAGFEPFCAFYGKRIAPSVKQALERQEYKIAPLIGRCSLRIAGDDAAARFGGARIFFNVNRPGDLEHAKRMTGGASC